MEINRRIELVKLLPENSVGIEVGVAEGNFSADLLNAGVKVLWSVDNWGTIDGVTGDGNFEQLWHDKNYATAKKNLSPFGNRSQILKGMSNVMSNHFSDEQVDLVYLDGAHYYDGVMADLKAYYPKLKSGGVMAGHDFVNTDYQVKEAVYDFIKMIGISSVVNVIPENHPSDASFYFIKP